MAGALSYVSAVAQLGLQTVTFRPKRKIGDFTAQVTISEAHSDSLEVTRHPTEKNAAIADHAFKLPATLVIRCGWSNSPSNPGYVGAVVGAIQGTVNGLQSLATGNSESQVKALYAKLLKVQADRTLLDIVTGKRDYVNMLLTDISTTTDKTTENSLIVEARFTQIIIVETKVVAVSAPPEAQAQPQATNPVTNFGQKALQATDKVLSYFDFIPTVRLP